MKNVTKAIKLASKFTEEEKQEFAEFFKAEEEVKEEVKEEVVVKEEVTKQEEVKKEDTSQIDTLLEQMGILAKEVKTLKETQSKTTSFGAKPKQGEGKSGSDFDDIFKQLK